MELDKNDGGRTVRVRKGELITVRLPENPTTGYRWTVSKAPEGVVSPTGDAYEARSDKPGSGGLRSFHFQATQPGRAIIKLMHHRSWESKEVALDNFEFIVEIAE
jgi:predicted secreted protein